MANNIISVALESATAWAPTPAIYQEYKIYAAELDRLVEAAREYHAATTFYIHGDDELEWEEVAAKQRLLKATVKLTAALREIELESK